MPMLCTTYSSHTRIFAFSHMSRMRKLTDFGAVAAMQMRVDPAVKMTSWLRSSSVQLRSFNVVFIIESSILTFLHLFLRLPWIYQTVCILDILDGERGEPELVPNETTSNGHQLSYLRIERGFWDRRNSISSRQICWWQEGRKV